MVIKIREKKAFVPSEFAENSYFQIFLPDKVLLALFLRARIYYKRAKMS